jgi:hypothetical protein
MPEQMHTQEAEVILRSEDPHRHIANGDQIGARVQVIEVPLVQPGESSVQVNRNVFLVQPVQDLLCPQVVLRANTEVKVSVWTQPWLRVKPGNRPALD